MPYWVKEIYYTLQGEGHNTGRAAVFCRFSGCNLWSGRADDRTGPGSCAAWCDTDFLGTDGPSGGRYPTPEQLAHTIASHWPHPFQPPHTAFVVFTGGEPLLQLDTQLIQATHNLGFEIAVETNGTRLPPPGIDWICVSPKAGTPLQLTHGDELKLVYPQQGLDPKAYESLAFKHFYLQPMDGPQVQEHIAQAVQYCLAHPRWKLSLQTHKIVGLR